MMVAEKMVELGTKKSTIQTIFEFGQKRAQEVGRENIFDFSLGNPNIPAPPFIKQAILDILTNTNRWRSTDTQWLLAIRAFVLHCLKVSITDLILIFRRKISS